MTTLRWRQPMAELHTWAGVLVGGLLMTIFFMGTLTVFDREIDRWMMPATRLAEADAPLSLDRHVRPALDTLAGGEGVRQWFVVLPNHREPVASLWLLSADGEVRTRFLDPASGALLPDVGTLGASSFFFPLHYNLHLTAQRVGYWIVGMAAVLMLAALVSGVVIHVRLFRDFFTFRPKKAPRRAMLDLHHLCGVLVLPFHLVIALSGLIIHFSTHLPAGIQAVYGSNEDAFFDDALGLYGRPAAGRAAPQAPLDAMLVQARHRWGHGEAGMVREWHPGDANAYVEIRRHAGDRIRANDETMYFDGVSGALLKHEPLKPMADLQRFITGLHVAGFSHGPLRWLYFIAGMTGCVMIATGMTLWTVKRREGQGAAGTPGTRFVGALACTAILGLLIATLAMLCANRLLPDGLDGRARWEVVVFFAAWLATAAHAAVAVARAPDGGPPWAIQCRYAAGLALLAPILNWVTTGDHPLRTMADGQWAVATVDAALLGTALTAAWAARRLARRRLEASLRAAAPRPLPAPHA